MKKKIIPTENHSKYYITELHTGIKTEVLNVDKVLHGFSMTIFRIKDITGEDHAKYRYYEHKCGGLLGIYQYNKQFASYLKELGRKKVEAAISETIERCGLTPAYRFEN